MASDVTDEDIGDVVDEYVRTYGQLIGHEIPRELAVATVRQTIQYMAAKAGVSEKTALLVVDVAWGRDLARQTYRSGQEQAACARAEPARQLPLTEVNRLIITLDLAVRYAAVNNLNLTNKFSPEAAKEAKDGLVHWALHSRAGDPTVIVAGNTVMYARNALSAFGDNLDSRRWTSCRCSSTACNKHRKTDEDVLRTVRQQLRLLGA